MNNTFVTKLDAVINNDSLQIFPRTLKAQWANPTEGGVFYANIITSSIGGNGRLAIIPVNSGDVVTFTPTSLTQILFQPLTEDLPITGESVVAVENRTTVTYSEQPYQYTVPSGAKYIIFYLSYDITNASLTYHFTVKVNNNDVRIPDITGW